MNKIRSSAGYFSKAEVVLWLSSVSLIVISFCLFDRENFLALGASLVGATSLIFAAKGNPVAQALMIVFSILYGIISYSVSYYGEMLTYLGMTGPMAVFALISWLRNPFGETRSEVKVNRLKKQEYAFIPFLTCAVTVAFYFILRYFGTAALIPSTLSVSTSFIAVYLTFRRSPYYAVGYAANDIVLIVLWVRAAVSDISCLSVVICFTVFLVNDIYGFISWRKMQRRQQTAASLPHL